MEPFLVGLGLTDAAGESNSARWPGKPAADAASGADVLLDRLGSSRRQPRMGEAFADLRTKPDAALPLRVRRAAEEVLGGKVRLQKRVSYEVTPDPAAGPRERAVFEALVGQSTTP